MKTLIEYIKECGVGAGSGFATPANTPGMGGIMAPEGPASPGSGDIPNIFKKKKKYKPLKDYINHNKNIKDYL